MAAERVSIQMPQKFRAGKNDLTKIVELRGTEVKDAVEKKFGGLTELCSMLMSDPSNGISESGTDIKEREKAFGSNILPEKKPKTFLFLLWIALKDPSLIVLELAAAISLAVSLWGLFGPNPTDDSRYKWITPVAILVDVFAIALVSAVNNYRNEKQFRSLQEKVRKEHLTTVIRDGIQKQIPSHELLVGDICMIKYGDVMPADGLLVSGHELRVDESSLTGESDQVKKHPDSDIRLLSGTNVMTGSGKALIVAVGLSSQSGKIFAMLTTSTGKKDNKKKDAGSTANRKKSTTSEVSVDESESYDKNADMDEQQSILQRKLAKLSKWIAVYGSLAAISTAAVMIIRFTVQQYAVSKLPWDNKDILEIFNGIMMGVTILVVAIPEGLPFAVTVTLAVSAKKMMSDHNLVRHLFACETMGCATTVCSDKTGTLTTNRMTVSQAFIGDKLFETVNTQEVDGKVMDLLTLGISVNSSYSSNTISSPDGGFPIQIGNKTECALLGFVTSCGRDCAKIREENPEEHFAKVYTFNSSRKYMSTVISTPGGWRVFCKGAAEIVLNKCVSKLDASGNIEEFTGNAQEIVKDEIIKEMALNGLRTICLAYRDIPSSDTVPDFENEDEVVCQLSLLAIFGIEDPVRLEVPVAIQQCRSAGITVRMVTGDNLDTASSVAIKCGIIKDEDVLSDAGIVLDSGDFNRRIRNEKGQIDQDLFDKVWPQLRVLARSTPQDKHALVRGIKCSRISKNREVVAVTGDGTNDAPALKKADVGFAMGIAGTDVAKEASDIILTDDNFTSIVKACMWGRNIYDNICKFLQFQLTVSLVALLISIISACAVGVTPIRAVPMLWINTLLSTLASLAFAIEPPTERLLTRAPYGRKASLLSRIMARNILGQASYQLTILLMLVFGRSKIFRFLDCDLELGIELDTLVFHSFVMMTVFNIFNSRCLHNERNVFYGLRRNWVYIAVFFVILGLQVIVVEFGGLAFWTRWLTLA